MMKFWLLPSLAVSVSMQPVIVNAQEPGTSYREHLVLGTVVAVKPDLALITIRPSDLLGNLRQIL